MTGEGDWRTRDLPDGRNVEFVNATLVSRDGDKWTIDVTVLIDGTNVGTQRVVVSSDLSS